MAFDKEIGYHPIFLCYVWREWRFGLKKIRDGAWKAVKASRRKPRISRLFFADDIMLFPKASKDQVELIKQGLEEFSRATNQQVSFNKSHMFILPNVRDQDAATLSKNLVIPLTCELGKY